MASDLEISPAATRQKQDLAWKHCQLLREGDKEHMKCNYCGKVFKGGGITRFKEHLAGRKRGGPMCLQVPTDVRLLMEQCLDGVTGKLSIRKNKMTPEDGTANALSPITQVFQTGLAIPEPVSRMPRGKTDVAWEHCHLFSNEKRGEIKCKYCGKLFKGGGIYRFKEHLAGRNSGGVPVCKLVPPDVRQLMLHKLNEIPYKERKRRKSVAEEENDVGSPPINVDAFANYGDDATAAVKSSGACNAVEPYLNLSLDLEGVSRDGKKRRRDKTSSVAVAVDDCINALGSNSKKVGNEFQMTMGRFLYDIGASLEALDSCYFQSFINMFVSGGSELLAPSYHDLRGWILKKLFGEVKNELDEYRTIWGRTGCSILVEEWSTESGRTLLSFLVYCNKGTVFLKSVDASRFRYSAVDLCGLIKQVVEEVGAANVLQVITNGDEHYAAVGKKLMEAFPTLYWTPCAANCIDLILEDFAKLEWIHAVIEQARSITRYIYNHSAVLNMMRKFTHGHDIVQQGATRSATNFTTLQKMADFKLNLQTMVTSQEWMDSPYSKQLGGLAMLDIISNQSFWSLCISIISLTGPLLRVLGTLISEKRTAMGYVLSGIYRAKETIKRELVKREDYMGYWNIIHHRWEQWQPPLHAAAFFLNPKFFYRIEGEMHNEVLSKMFDCIEKLVPETEVQDGIVKELNIYKNADGDLGRKMAIRARETLLPGEWWSAYGGACPHLSRLAIRILSQTCSTIGYRPSHIPFEKVHEARNCLERQRLTDVVFVQYNLRLKQMNDGNKQQVPADPISFDKINIMEDWIMQNELCLEDYESIDWMSLVPPCASTLPLGGSSADEAEEDSGAGFDDIEIFEGLKGN